MKKIMIAMACVALSVQCTKILAGTFSSTSVLNQSFNLPIPFQSAITPAVPGINTGIDIGRSYNARILSGVTSASLSVDTDSDMGFVSGMQFKPFGFAGNSGARSTNLQELVVDVPGNFPIPPVTHIENHVYREQVAIDSLTAVTPTLLSSTTDPIEPFNFKIPWFRMFNTLTVAAPSIFIGGTYMASGPTVSRTVPFSVEYRPVSSQLSQHRIGIKGGSNFGNGFEVLVGNNIAVTYEPVNGVIFDEDVDSLHFRFDTREFATVLLAGVPVPEPAAVGLWMCAMVSLAALRRRQAKAKSPSLYELQSRLRLRIVCGQRHVSN